SLSNAELAQIFTTATGTVTFGDASQTGTITFAAATPATTSGAGVIALQSPTGPGSIVLDSSQDTALSTGSGGGRLSPRTRGIVATGGGARAALASSGPVSLDTAGGVGSSSSRLLFDAAQTPSRVAVGDAVAPSGGVYLGGLGALTLGDVHIANAPL